MYVRNFSQTLLQKDYTSHPMRKYPYITHPIYVAHNLYVLQHIFWKDAQSPCQVSRNLPQRSQ